MMRIAAVLTLLLPLLSLSGAAAPEVLPIPKLDTKGAVYKTEGENDPLIYDDAVGTKKMIMVYADFEDAAIEESTQDRGRRCLGGDLFEKLFGEQSYGKLDFEITHIHGWRRLPGVSGDYSTRETDTHREMFVQVFKLYPEVNFLDYDYIVAVMPRVGNTAFGEREELAIPYRGKKIKVAMNLSSPTPYVFAHEVGHLMGLPDLYTYTHRGPFNGPKNPAGPWDIMSGAGTSTGFLGWHRHKLDWLDAQRKTYLTSDVSGFTITPLDAAEGVSMIAIPVDDAEKPSKVFVIEEAQDRRFKDKRRVDGDGLLVYLVDATIPTGRNPVVVYPKTDINKAAFQPGDTFEHADAPFTMKVISKEEDGSYRVDIRMVKP